MFLLFLFLVPPDVPQITGTDGKPLKDLIGPFNEGEPLQLLCITNGGSCQLKLMISTFLNYFFLLFNPKYFSLFAFKLMIFFSFFLHSLSFSFLSTKANHDHRLPGGGITRWWTTLLNTTTKMVNNAPHFFPYSLLLLQKTKKKSNFVFFLFAYPHLEQWQQTN